MRTVLLVVALLGGCGASGLTIANGTALGVSTVSLACDWGQTRAYATDDGWRSGSENNPILGHNPSAVALDAYFIAAIAANAVIWRFAPRKVRAVLPTIITAVQLHAMITTQQSTTSLRAYYPGVCGVDSMTGR
jgi:hypothetical protein